MAQSQQETAVGISAYVSPEIPGLTCTIKQRYTDFLVNEITTNGNVLHLTNTSVPASGQKRKRQQNETANEKLNDSKEAPGIGGAETQSPLQDAGNANGERGESPHKKQRMDAATDAPMDEDGSSAARDDLADAGKTKKERKADAIATVSESNKTAIQEVFGGQIAHQILGLYADTVIYPEKKPRDLATIHSQPITEKPKRTAAHATIRKIFSGKLETATLQDQPGVISIKAASTKVAEGARGKLQVDVDGAMQKGKLGWSDLGGEYLHFTLYKENKDTMEALYFIATQLKVRVNMFQFAGTKDRRGVTVQRVAIFRVRAEQVAKLNQHARGWRVGDFKYENHGLELGDSSGNEFLLTLRDCECAGGEGLDGDQRLELARKVVSEAGESFQRRGFLNYYGLQRFGTYATGTHIVGQKMLQGDLKGAVDCILAYDESLLPEKIDEESSAKIPQDDIARADTIRKWRETGQYHEKDRSMPKRFQAESSIMQYLSKRDKNTGKMQQDQDWQGALTTIQRSLRLMYVHAYQSYVWNFVAGRRWEMHGDSVLEGDLVVVGEKDGGDQTSRDQVDEDGEPVFHPAEHDTAQDPDDAFTRARPLSKVEAESGKFDIFDIVLPLPGYDVEYPANSIGEYYKDFMGSEAGGKLDPHNMRRAWKDLSLSGAYRKLMARPGLGFSMEVKRYQDENEQMVETDLERLKREQKAGANGRMHGGESAAVEGAAPGEVQSAEQGDRIAIVLKMQLGSSQYATMALRELTKGGAMNFRPDYSAR